MHVQVSRARGGVAQFSFEELCGRPLGAADYIALAQAYHTVFVIDIPAMSLEVWTCSGYTSLEGHAGYHLPGVCLRCWAIGLPSVANVKI